MPVPLPTIYRYRIGYIQSGTEVDASRHVLRREVPETKGRAPVAFCLSHVMMCFSADDLTSPNAGYR